MSIPLDGAGDELRRTRTARGESLEEAAAALRIDPRHLAALERNDPDALPDGPFAQGWLRVYREHLGLPTERDPRVAPKRLDPNRVPMWALRAVAGGAALLAILLAGLQLFPRDRAVEVPVTALGPPDQHVVVKALRNAHVRVLVDGSEVYDRLLVGGDEFDVVGHDRIEVQVDAPEDVSITYNDVRIEPQGRQDRPRRLVFLDDVQAAEETP